mgnify:FL=1
MVTPPAEYAARKIPQTARYIMEKQAATVIIDKMFSYQSFLLHPKKKVTDLENIPPGTFIYINDEEGIRKIAKYIGYDEIEGAIILNYYDQSILTLRNWDYVDILWNNLVKSVDEVLHAGKATCRFWGCPCEISIKECGHNFVIVRTNWSDKRYTLPEKEFFMTILYGATDFFNRLSSPPWEHRTYAERIACHYDIMGRMNEKFGLEEYPWDSLNRT